MGLVEYTMDEHVAVLTMNSGENRFNWDFFDAFNKALDEIENEADARVLVVKSAHEKIWSNGIDLEWIIPLVQAKDEAVQKFPYVLTKLYKRLLLYPMITVAALNGHAFAGGCIMAAAFDFRFMRSDRGFFCIPEVDINIPLSPSMIAVMKKAVPLYKFLEMQYTGLRMTGDECEKHHVVMKSCPNEQLMGEVMAFAKMHKKDRNMIKVMKELTYKEEIRIFDEDDPAWFTSGKTGLV